MSRDVTQICAGCSGGPDYLELGSGAPPCQPSYRMRTVTVQSLSIRKALAQVMPPALRDKNEQRLHGSWDWGPRLEKHNILQAALSLELLLLLSPWGSAGLHLPHLSISQWRLWLDCPQQVTQRLSTQYPELKDTSFRCSTDKLCLLMWLTSASHDASVMYVALERADSCPH